MHVLLAVQWVVFHMGLLISLSISLGVVLGLSQSEIGTLMQLSFFITGVASMVQLRWGHKVLSIEGPGAPWMAAYIIVAGVGFSMGKPASLILTDISGAMIISGVCMALLGALGFVKKAQHYFTPRVTGVLLMLLGIQIGGVAVKGLVGSGLLQFLIGISILFFVMYLLFNTKGVIKNSAILIGFAVGWIACIFAGVASLPDFNYSGLVNIPQLFPWGYPTYDLGTALSLLLLGFFMIPIMVGSIAAVGKVMEEEEVARKYDPGLVFSGLANFGAGVLGGHGTVPYAVSAGLIAVTGNKERRPFFLGALLFVFMGILGPLGVLVGSIPPVIVNSMLLIPAVSLLDIGIKSIVQKEIGPKDSYIIGLSLLAGLGVMMLPMELLQDIPSWLATVVGNGVIVGAFVAILLEIFRERKGGV
ncbi:xanthine/uracil permease [Desulfitispora alkaliphila]|uniref:uracil-xanthine permease family protein n=1 Tax=Desulfitispora alkaliphila TaxID=622674 RepID=UPI003D1DA69D